MSFRHSEFRTGFATLSSVCSLERENIRQGCTECTSLPYVFKSFKLDGRLKGVKWMCLTCRPDVPGDAEGEKHILELFENLFTRDKESVVVSEELMMPSKIVIQGSPLALFAVVMPDDFEPQPQDLVIRRGRGLPDPGDPEDVARGPWAVVGDENANKTVCKRTDAADPEASPTASPAGPVGPTGSPVSSGESAQEEQGRRPKEAVKAEPSSGEETIGETEGEEAPATVADVKVEEDADEDQRIEDVVPKVHKGTGQKGTRRQKGKKKTGRSASRRQRAWPQPQDPQGLQEPQRNSPNEGDNNDGGDDGDDDGGGDGVDADDVQGGVVKLEEADSSGQGDNRAAATTGSPPPCAHTTTADGGEDVGVDESAPAATREEGQYIRNSLDSEMEIPPPGDSLSPSVDSSSTPMSPRAAPSKPPPAGRMRTKAARKAGVDDKGGPQELDAKPDAPTSPKRRRTSSAASDPSGEDEPDVKQPPADPAATPVQQQQQQQPPQQQPQQPQQEPQPQQVHHQVLMLHQAGTPAAVEVAPAQPGHPRVVEYTYYPLNELAAIHAIRTAPTHTVHHTPQNAPPTPAAAQPQAPAPAPTQAPAPAPTQAPTQAPATVPTQVTAQPPAQEEGHPAAAHGGGMYPQHGYPTSAQYYQQGHPPQAPHRHAHPQAHPQAFQQVQPGRQGAYQMAVNASRHAQYQASYQEAYHHQQQQQQQQYPYGRPAYKQEYPGYQQYPEYHQQYPEYQVYAGQHDAQQHGGPRVEYHGGYQGYPNRTAPAAAGQYPQGFYQRAQPVQPQAQHAWNWCQQQQHQQQEHQQQEQQYQDYAHHYHHESGPAGLGGPPQANRAPQWGGHAQAVQAQPQAQPQPQARLPAFYPTQTKAQKQESKRARQVQEEAQRIYDEALAMQKAQDALRQQLQAAKAKAVVPGADAKPQQHDDGALHQEKGQVVGQSVGQGFGQSLGHGVGQGVGQGGGDDHLWGYYDQAGQWVIHPQWGMQAPAAPAPAPEPRQPKQSKRKQLEQYEHAESYHPSQLHQQWMGSNNNNNNFNKGFNKP
ncbi:trithorax group protein osa-like isoform X2 [Frankliniella occidentalis]|uniref:Trithorax group protein osa-like isoform X2 n=1 Tax=Frankliniella occidentalis TaxID=133901 RepID=A0A9C6WWP3_FRAOC|nr:trithorax group protein osa-like isoform X2 [Frankliniella occidentalis]